MKILTQNGQLDGDALVR